jgi:hypothetical protein
MIIAMDDDQRQQLYDEIVAIESADQDHRGGAFDLYWRALYDNCETPEEALAAELVVTRAYSEHNRIHSHFPEFAAVKWPWGDARGILRAGGRTYFEARLRLRDKLVASARELTNTNTSTGRPSSAASGR